MRKLLFGGLLLAALYTLTACPGKDEKAGNGSATTQAPAQQVKLPDFSADSAYKHVGAQVAFGPRIPGSDAHKKCVDYLVAELKKYAAEVEVQEGKVKAYNGAELPCRNIIARFHPEQKSNRVLLTAHYDTRPWADQEADEAAKKEKIDGANDGASGAGVLLELARHISQSKPGVGVTIALFDVEDYGTPKFEKGYMDENTYCLGTQLWAKSLSKTAYVADYAVNLDMVGAKDARFCQEGYSLQFASPIVQKVWNKASQLGYYSYFIFRPGGSITDDHYYINTIAGIPAIDIVDLDPNRPMGFGHYWHTRKDNMEVIDKNTLKAVGQTLLGVIYEGQAQ